MNILILGGTKFLGRHYIGSLLKNNHQITMFNRNKTNPNLYADIETIVGDRNIETDLLSLKSRKWDAVIDTCGYFPSQLEKSTEVLKDVVGKYVFVSTMSVYKDPTDQQSDESAETYELETGVNPEEDTMSTYGLRKKLCEDIVVKNFPDKYLIPRPCVIVGPYDSTWRFPYWVERISRGGDVFSPGDPNDPVRFIDARDLADWTINMIKENKVGIFNTLGPETSISFDDFLSECRETLNVDCKLNWISEEFIKENKVSHWRDLPLWTGKEYIGLHQLRDVAARKNGLSSRKLSQTILDTFEWIKKEGITAFGGYGLEPERETDLLRMWKNI